MVLVRVFFEVFIIISSRRLFEHVDDWGKTITIAMVVYPRRAPPPRKAVQERRALFCRGEGQRRRRRRRCVQRDERRGEERHLCYKSVAVVEITRVVRNIKMAPFFTTPTKTLNKTCEGKKGKNDENRFIDSKCIIIIITSCCAQFRRKGRETTRHEDEDEDEDETRTTRTSSRRRRRRRRRLRNDFVFFPSRLFCVLESIIIGADDDDDDDDAASKNDIDGDGAALSHASAGESGDGGRRRDLRSGWC